MTKDEAEKIRDSRKEEQPQFEWVVQRRAAGDWAVLRLPAGSGIDRSTVKGQKGEPIDVGDDPRAASERNIPPYLCRDQVASARSGVSLLWVAKATRGCGFSAGGGALSPLGRPGGPSAERLTGAVAALSDGVRARAPGLISVRGPG